MQLQSWLQFLTDGIWRITEDEVTPVRKRLYSCVKIIYLSVDQFLNDRIPVRASALTYSTLLSFLNDRIPVRASALTYSTLLSIIPILALLFAIARGFGFDALMEEQIKSGVMSQQSELIFSWVNSYLQHAQSGIFIGIGLIMLLFTILTVHHSDADRQYRAQLQCHLASKTSAHGLPANNRLFFDVIIAPLVDCYLQRSDYLHDHVCERFRDFPFIGTNAEIPGTAYPVCLDLGNVYRAICIHAQYQRQT